VKSDDTKDAMPNAKIKIKGKNENEKCRPMSLPAFSMILIETIKKVVTRVVF